MEKYKKAHLWLLIPFALAVMGFWRSYFMNFTGATWGQHIHGLSAILWFGFVISQPYLATHGQLKKHRRNGIIGMFLAGMVVASALAVIPGNIRLALTDIDPPVAPDFFLYGVSFIDLITITGFGLSVIMAIIKSKNLDDHALWMISTVFWALMPALARLALVPLLWMDTYTHFANLAMITTPFIILAALIIMIRMKRAHPALIAVIAGNLSVYLIVPLGENQWWIDLAVSLFSFN